MVAVHSVFHTKSGNHCWYYTTARTSNLFERFDTILNFQVLFFIKTIQILAIFNLAYIDGIICPINNDVNLCPILNLLASPSIEFRCD